jgi:type I restriction-modification system DNA methylase subunit|nr:MAG TPA: N-6 DNA Methylase [Bacteriophage sp.]
MKCSGQVKSKNRVRDFGEVFTDEREVKAMCDLIPDWTGNVLEPACGNGNFLVEVLNRKLASGMTQEQAASTIFGIDIQPDNVAETIERLCKIAPKGRNWFERNILCGDFLNPNEIWFLEGR